MILVDLGEEFVQLGAGHSQTRPLERSAQFFLIDFAVVVFVDGFEKMEQLFFGILNECMEF